MMTDFRSVDLVLDGGNVVAAVNKVILTDKIFAENAAKSERQIRQLLEEASRRSASLSRSRRTIPLATQTVL